MLVYLKNGEKAPVADANFVKLDAGQSPALLRCLFCDREVALFKWDEVAGYTISVLAVEDASPASAYRAWGLQPETGQAL